MGCSRTSVVAEAIYIGLVAHPVLRDRVFTAPVHEPPLTTERFLRFYAPLMVTPIFLFFAMPLITAAMSRMPMALDSLAVWPVLNEAMYLLNFSWKAQEALWEMLERGVVVLLPLESEELSRMRELMKKYKDLPMDLADAALVAVAEREKIRRIFTLDRRDFAVYRPARLGRFILLPQ